MNTIIWHYAAMASYSRGELNGVGQLGDGTTYLDRDNPVQVNNLTDVMDVEAGFYHSLALKSDKRYRTGEVTCFSELGDGTTTNRSTPVQVSGLSDIVSISTKNYHSLAIKSDGTVWAWGHNTGSSFGRWNNDDSVNSRAGVWSQ